MNKIKLNQQHWILYRHNFSWKSPINVKICWKSVSNAVQCSADFLFCIHSIRSPGSAAVNMCLVACGSADAYYHMGIHCWDMAGGAAVVTEAGGVIVDISGEAAKKLFQTPFIYLSRWIVQKKWDTGWLSCGQNGSVADGVCFPALSCDSGWSSEIHNAEAINVYSLFIFADSPYLFYPIQLTLRFVGYVVHVSTQNNK